MLWVLTPSSISSSPTILNSPGEDRDRLHRPEREFPGDVSGSTAVKFSGIVPAVDGFPSRALNRVQYNSYPVIARQLLPMQRSIRTIHHQGRYVPFYVTERKTRHISMKQYHYNRRFGVELSGTISGNNTLPYSLFADFSLHDSCIAPSSPPKNLQSSWSLFLIIMQ